MTSAARRILLLSSLLLLPLLVLALLLGPIPLGFADLFKDEPLTQRVLWELRFPRLLIVMLTGALLAVAGAVVQALFRNPLADPGLIGVSGGAALAAVAWQVLAVYIPVQFVAYIGMPIAAFAGGVLVTMFVIAISRSAVGVSSLTLLLAGIAINALAGAGISGLKYLTDSLTLRQVTFWLMGSVQTVSWWAVGVLGLLAVLAAPYLFRISGQLNLLLLGEQQAQLLGVEVDKLQLRLVLLTALIVGVVVSLVGLIGFVGLVVPHIVRLLFGPDNRILIPFCAVFGAMFLLLSDMLSRTLISPAELPIGLLTALIGAPVFLGILIHQRKGGRSC